VDPKFRHFFDYAGATVFKPNRRIDGGGGLEWICGQGGRWRQSARRVGADGC
jgi:hypothetical protein